MVYVFIPVFWALWGMSNGVEWTLQAEKMDLHWMGMNLIAAQVQTANPILILLFIPLVNYVIYPAIDRFFPLTPLRKIGIGLFLTAALSSSSGISRGRSMPDEAEHQLAVPRLCDPDFGRSDGFHHRPGIFLHPGAEQDEKLDHGSVALYRCEGRPLHRVGQLLHS